MSKAVSRSIFLTLRPHLVVRPSGACSLEKAAAAESAPVVINAMVAVPIDLSSFDAVHHQTSRPELNPRKQWPLQTYSADGSLRHHMSRHKRSSTGYVGVQRNRNGSPTKPYRIQILPLGKSKRIQRNYATLLQAADAYALYHAREFRDNDHDANGKSTSSPAHLHLKDAGGS